MKNPLKKKSTEKARPFTDELTTELARLREENKNLRVENQSLQLEAQRQEKLVAGYFQAGCLIAEQVKKLREENIALKLRSGVVRAGGDGNECKTEGNGG